jgi:hypothetical protein
VIEADSVISSDKLVVPICESRLALKLQVIARVMIVFFMVLLDGLI